jgi:hypothetical protein
MSFLSARKSSSRYGPLWFFEYEIKSCRYYDARIYIEIIEIQKIRYGAEIAAAIFIRLCHAFSAVRLKVVYFKPGVNTAYFVSGNPAAG